MTTPSNSQSSAQGSSPLVAEFLSIRLPDGRPDTDSRMRALDTLLTVLTPWERWHLRARMNEVATGLALLPSLPGEIIALIGYHLDLRDIYACRAVSTAWRDIWKREDVARDLLRNLYPGLFECSMAKVQHESAVHLLDRTNRMVLRRKNSRFVARLTEPDCYKSEIVVSKMSPDPDAHPDGLLPAIHLRRHIRRNWPSVGSTCQYSNGRFIQQSDSCCYFLDNFRTGHQRLVSWTEGNLLGIATRCIALTSHLIVLASVHLPGSLLVVYHIELQEFRKITLPSRLARCYANHTSIGLALRPNSEMYLWRWDEKLQSVPLPSPHSEITEQHDQTGFMFHPTNPKLFSIATLNMVRSGPESDVKFSDDLFHQDPDGITYSFRLHVSDYNDRTLVSTKTHTLDNVPRYFSPLRWQLYRESDPYALLPPAQNFHQPIDAHGGHAFFAADPTVGHMVLVEYNVVTRRLTVPLCSSTPPLFRSIWWGQGRNAHAGRNPFLWNRMFYMHAKRADVRNHGMGEDLEFLLRVLDLECATEEGKGHSRLSFPSEHIFAGGDSSLHGDDRYLVLSHHPSDSQYTVWDFGDADAEEEGGKEVTMKGWLTREEVTKMLSVEGAVDKGSLD